MSVWVRNVEHYLHSETPGLVTTNSYRVLCFLFSAHRHLLRALGEKLGFFCQLDIVAVFPSGCFQEIIVFTGKYCRCFCFFFSSVSDKKKKNRDTQIQFSSRLLTLEHSGRRFRLTGGALKRAVFIRAARRKWRRRRGGGENEILRGGGRGAEEDRCRCSQNSG